MSEIHEKFDADIATKLYIQALKDHDWYYEYTDDHRVYCAGVDERCALNKKAEEIDPNASLWNWYCPPEYRKMRR